MWLAAGQYGDALWVVLLCAFSWTIRNRKARFCVPCSIGLLLLLVLAAFHSRPLWSSETGDGRSLQSRPARIFKVPPTFYETGLEIRDIITSLAVDSEHKVWLASASSGPYVYAPATNEVDNLLEPDTIYGLFADHSAVWVLTSSGAHLYQASGIIRSLGFPNGSIPVAGAVRPDGSLLFSTNTALFQVRPENLAMTSLPFSHPLTRILPAPDNSVLLVGPQRVWRMGTRAAEQLSGCGQQTEFAAALQIRDELFLSTTSDGILKKAGQHCELVSFARSSLNSFQPGCAVSHRGIPCFGAADGSVVFFKNNQWKRMKISRVPVTALASDGSTLYAWTDGQLLAVRI